MQITEHIKAEILQVMQDYWNSYFNGGLDQWGSYVPDHYRNIGTTKEEIWHCKQDIFDHPLWVMDQMVGMADLRNKTVDNIPMDPYIMVHELGDLHFKEAKIDFNNTLFTKTGFGDLPDNIKKEITDPDSVACSHSLMKYGLIRGY